VTTQTQREAIVAFGFVITVLIAATIASAATGVWYWLLAASSGVLGAVLIIAAMTWLSDWIDRGE
jgi:hypothetical protein